MTIKLNKKNGKIISMNDEVLNKKDSTIKRL